MDSGIISGAVNKCSDRLGPTLFGGKTKKEYASIIILKYTGKTAEPATLISSYINLNRVCVCVTCDRCLHWRFQSNFTVCLKLFFYIILTKAVCFTACDWLTYFIFFLLFLLLYLKNYPVRANVIVTDDRSYEC